MKHIYIVAMAFACLATCACGSGGKETASDASKQPEQALAAVPTFSADSAMAVLRAQVDLGPRVPGSAAHSACADLLAAQLKAYGATVSDATVSVPHPTSGNAVPVRNIFAQFNPEAQARVLILAHYDTRPWADEDADTSKHNTPIDGANDGASGVAVALEVARLVADKAPAVGVDILLTDQEDSGTSAPAGATQEQAAAADRTWCIGSRAFAENLPYTAQNMPRFAILLDMVGGRDAVFYREYFSQQYAASTVDKVWSKAASLGYTARFRNDIGGAVNDDHIALLQAGIPTVDIIEIGHDATGSFNPTWHTMADNIHNIDPATIRMVGSVLTNVIYSEKP